MLITAAGIAGGASATQLPEVVPITVYQCVQNSRPGPYRDACIKRVLAGKPGSSCQHPFLTETTGFDQKGDKKFVTVELHGKNPQAPAGVPWHVQVEVRVHNPHLVVCPRTELKVWVRTVEEVERGIPGPGTLHTYFPIVEPELGGGYTSGALTVPWGDYTVVAMARWKHS